VRYRCRVHARNVTPVCVYPLRQSLDGPSGGAFATELQLLLSSTGLPAYLLAAFAKRLSRLALVASPPCAALCCAVIFNVMLQHPSVRLLVNRPPKAPNGSAPPVAGSAAADFAFWSDPYLEAEEDPEACGAMQSCLWEIDSLRSHASPMVASLAALFSKPIDRLSTPVDLIPLASATYGSLAQLEFDKKTRAAPLAIHPPVAVFGDAMTKGRAELVPGGGGLDGWQ